MTLGMTKQILKLTGALLLVFVTSCSGSGSGGGDDGGGGTTITGTIASSSGSQSDMNSWVLVMTEKTGLSRVSEIDASGGYKFSQARLDKPQTMVLLSPEYILQSVLALPGDAANQIRQFMKISTATVPKIVQKGKVLNLSALNGIEMQSDYAKDTDGDGVPDGPQSLSLTSSSHHGTNLASVDTDGDGVDNSVDPDIDGDGLMNWFDDDDDGDGIPDVADSDANANLVTDSTEKIGDLYFSEIFDYIHVQYQTVAQATGSAKNYLVFTSKVAANANVGSLKIRGSSSLLSGSTVDGAAWDLKLSDDGKSEDGSAGDLVYGKKVLLASGVTPRSQQVVFFQLTQNGSDYAVEVPYTFPNISLASITASMDSSRNVTLVGDPFGSITDFKWTVTVYNSSHVKIYESNETSGSNRTVAVSASSMPSGATYYYVVTAKLGERVPTLPSYLVKSLEYSISL